MWVLRWLLVIVLATTSFVMGRDALAVPAEPPDPPALATGVLPVWSGRRLPEALALEVAATQAAAVVPAALEGTDHCLVVAERGQVLGSWQGSQTFVPASTLKLLTGTVALSVLSPGHRFETRIVAATAPDGAGHVGDVWLVGGGDPVLGTEGFVDYLADNPERVGHPRTPVEALAEGLARAGVSAVDGNLYADDLHHELARAVETWGAGDAGQFVAPLGALMVDQAFVDYVDRERADDPALHAGAVVAGLLDERGIELGGSVERSDGDPSTGVPADGVVLATVQSPPLSEIVEAMLRESDNTIAELLLREVGSVAAGVGSTVRGAAIGESELERMSVPTDGLVWLDGSGLSRGDQVSCETLVGVLALTDDPWFGSIRAGLPVAGESGTLVRRFEGDDLEGRLAAKTGSLTGVAGLAGFVRGGPAGRELSFAYLGESVGFVDDASRDASTARAAEAVGTLLDALLDPVVLGPTGAPSQPLGTVEPEPTATTGAPDTASTSAGPPSSLIDPAAEPVDGAGPPATEDPSGGVDISGAG